MEEEEEICRVCRSEGTLEQPLFHPCKCAGSIRHVHQDCLIEWLSHSKKKYCELCEHPFTFTPVYRQDMPEVIPTKLIFQQFRKKIAYILLTVSRAILVSCIWLIILPYFTVWVWRMYFFLGNHVSKRLVRLQEMKNQIGSATSTNNITTILFNNAVAGIHNDTATLNWLQEYKSRLTMQSFLADCFEGQIITCIVVIIFVAVFLLREWIVQNIPMDAPPVIEEVEEVEQEQEPIVQQPMLIERPVRPVVINNNQRFDSLFDIHWEDQEDRPLSPVAEVHNPMEPSSSSSVFQSSNNNNNDKRTRAASMPPSLSRSSSFIHQYEDNNDDDTFNLRIGNDHHSRRSASMEPSIDTSMVNNERIVAATQGPDSPVFINRGHPPHAPRMRHAEAPVPIRPIPEENEEENHNNNNRQVENNNNQPEDADEEDNIEEFEGVLEAIGMNGSIWSLLQNSALMGLLIALSLGAAVWMPYLIGMLFIMTETLDLIRIPLKLTRLITDPLIDFLFMVCSDYIWPFFVNLYTENIQPLIDSTTVFDKISVALMYIVNCIKEHGLFSADSSHTTLSDQVQALNGTANDNFIDTSIQYMTKLLNETEPMLEHAFNRYQALATGQTAVDRFACIAVGYMVVILVSCWYLARATHNNLATAAFGRTAQEAIRHQGIIFKVGMFITIELVLFPIVCGFLLDASTMPLFKHATLLGRLGYLRSHPVPSIFLHWFLGTGFMFLFAVLVTICRDIVRPGVMWFIRDPNDPQFHPIREIVERPVFFQFKKIGASALIYLTVILVGVGGVVHCINTIASGVLPLRWSLSDYTDTSNPLSIVPIDLIVIQVGIPAIVKYFEPKQTIKRLFIKWTKTTCRYLRLTSFIFGSRRPEEEGSLVYHSYWAWLANVKPDRYPEPGRHEDVIGSQVSYLWDGQLLRVPRHDSVPIIERRRMLVPIDHETLEPIDEVERMMGHPASSAAGGEEVNTVIVYSPPDFKERLLLFVGFMWLSSSVFFCTMTVLPVVFGRHVFKEYFHVQNEVHDIYSFVLGGAILLLCGAFVSRCYKAIKDIWCQTDWSDSISTLWNHIKSFSSWAVRWTWFIWSFGIVLPLTFGILIELYFVLPLRQLGQDSPTVEVMPMWSHGFACMVIFHGFIQVVPDPTGRNIINNVFRGGIGNMNIKESITKLIGPLLLVSGVAICLPFIIAFINMKVVARTNPELRVKLVQIAYPTALIGIGTYYLSKIGSRIGRRLTETVREDNYLVGRTLHNLDH